MNYIVLDMEWNQAPCAERTIRKPVPLTGEIIQMGAVKLNDRLEMVDDFNAYIRPKYYTKIKREIVKLTGITNQMLAHGAPFALAFYQFLDWCGEDALLFTWGTDDIRMLKNNLIFHGMEDESYPKAYDLQLIYSFQELGEHAQHSLHSAVEHFSIPEDDPAHDALNDAYYTARIAQRLDLEAGLREYQNHLSVWMSHVPIAEEEHGPFSDKLAALRNRAVRGVSCPDCGKQLVTPRWISLGGSKKIVRAVCPEHGGFLYRMLFLSMGRKGYQVKKEAYRADDALDEYYQARLSRWRERMEKQRQKEAALSGKH